MIDINLQKLTESDMEKFVEALTEYAKGDGNGK